MITLQIPEGCHCEGCMFLDAEWYRLAPACRLFGADLTGDCDAETGQIAIGSIKKSDMCPKEQVLVPFIGNEETDDGQQEEDQETQDVG